MNTDYKTDIEILKDGFKWLTKNWHLKDILEGGVISPAVKVGGVYARSVSRIKHGFETGEIDKESLKQIMEEIKLPIDLKEVFLRRFCSDIPEDQRMAKIEELFIKLKQGNDWILKHEEQTEKVEECINRAAPIVDELEGLGVTRTLSTALLIMGAVITPKLTDQFMESTSEYFPKKEKK